VTTWRLRGLLPTATGSFDESDTDDQEPESPSAGVAGGASPSPGAHTSTRVPIDVDYVWIHDLLEERTPASAAWYDECHAAAKKLRKSADLDEEGE